MSRRRSIADWRNAVFATSLVTDPVKVLLLLLADDMRADRKVSVPRKVLAARLGRHEQRAERIRSAREAGLLTVVSAGCKGHTAVYQGLFPDHAWAAKRTELEYARSSLNRYAITPDGVPDGQYTTTKAVPSQVAQTPTSAPMRSHHQGERPSSRVDGPHDVPSDRRECA